MLSQVPLKSEDILLPRRLDDVLALDRAHVAANNILGGRLISPSALVNNKIDLFDDKNQIQNEFRRGFLISLSATLSNLQETLVILGTELSLQNADHVYPAVAKQPNEDKITNFPLFDQNDVSRILSDLVDMEDCVVPEPKRRKLSGRARFAVDVVNRLTKPSTTGDSKQMMLENAIESSIAKTMEHLRKTVRNILSYDQISQIIANFGASSTSQSDAFEPLVCRSLQYFNGFSLVDLPCLQGIKLPAWRDNLTLQIDDINTANGLGYSAAGVHADLAFLSDRPQNKMLIPQFGTRPDRM
ncbi:unnamed protein product [Umbelopsis ramanniana]